MLLIVEWCDSDWEYNQRYFFVNSLCRKKIKTNSHLQGTYQYLCFCFCLSFCLCLSLSMLLPHVSFNHLAGIHSCQSRQALLSGLLSFALPDLFCFRFPWSSQICLSTTWRGSAVVKVAGSTFGSTASFGNARETKVVMTLQWLQARSIQGKSGLSVIRIETNVAA